MRSLRYCSLILLAACGGGGSDTVAPPPPPPGSQPGPPATLVVQAGNNQQSVPGTAVPVRPAVLVRDAGGRAVAGVSVSFVVDAGGGSVSGSTVSSGTDGIASVGSWTLGPGEGVNRLKATVAGLSPVLLTATGAFPAVTLIEQNIGAGGGSLIYHKAGDPLDGLTLTIPAGAFTAGGHWKIESKPKAAAPQNPRLHQVIPVIVVSTDQGMADSLLTLTIPVHLPADSVGTALLYDPASQQYEGLPTVSWTTSSITVATRHFSASHMIAGTASGSASHSAAVELAPLDLDVLMTSQAFNAQAALTAYGAGGVTTQFDPAVDSWEFGNYGSYITNNGGHSTGTALSALYYFLKLKSVQGLFGQFAKWNFWAGNAQGYRLAAMTETDVNWPQANANMQQLDNYASAKQINPGLVHYFNLLAAMAISGRPQVIFAGARPGLRGYVALLAYKVTPTEVWAADPNNPGQTIKIPFNGDFQSTPVTFFTGAPTYSTNLFRFAGTSALIDWWRLESEWALFDAGTVGDGVFPSYTIEYFDDDFQLWKPFPQNNQLSISWTDIKLRARCPACQVKLGSQPSDLAALDVYARSGSQLATDRSNGSVTFRLSPTESSVGVHILGGRQCTGCPVFWGHIDFKILTINSSHFYVTPDPATGTSTDPITLTVKNLAAGTPRPIRYDWDFGDGKTATVSNDSTVIHRWTQGGVYNASVVITDVTTGTRIGKVTVRVTIDQAVPIWRITSWTATYFGPNPLTDFSGQIQTWFTQDAAIFSGLPARPDGGLLFYFAAPFSSGGKDFTAGLYLQGNFPSTSFVASWPTVPLARVAPVPPVDGFLEKLTLDAASQSGDLSSGTIGGSSVTRVRDMSGWPMGSGVHTVTHWDVSAQKNGTTLSGTITYYVEQWGELGCQEQHNADGSITIVGCFGGFAGTAGYRFSFSAVRIK